MILNNESNKKKKFEQFFIMTYPKVKAFAWKLLKSEEDAEDIAQIYSQNYGLILRFGKIRNLEQLHIYNGPNHIYNFLKHKSIRQTYQEQCTKEEPAISETDIHDQLYAKESELDKTYDCQYARTEEEKSSEWAGHRKSNQEIADELDISIRTVERHIYLALQSIFKKVLLTLFFSISAE